jgi:TonB family protein
MGVNAILAACGEKVRDDRAVRTRGFSLKAVILGFMVAAAALPSAGQSTEAELSARLIGKDLYLHGMWGDDRLFFKADGKPEPGYTAIPFTEAAFEAKSVKLKGNRLEIEGQRLGVTFSKEGEVKLLPLKSKKYKGKVTIEVVGSPGGDFGPALDAIFAPDLASLAPSLPEEWRYYARKNFLPPGAVAPANLTPQSEFRPVAAKDADGIPVRDNRAMHVGGSVRPPKVLKSVEPSFTEAARQLKFSGHVQIYLWVDEAGAVSHVRIAKPAGVGLDEAAVAAVKRYSFQPATQNGTPVKVDLYIDVNFEIF